MTPDLELGDIGPALSSSSLSNALITSSDNNMSQRPIPQRWSTFSFPCFLIGLVIVVCVVIPLLSVIFFVMACDVNNCIDNWLRNQTYIDLYET